MKSFVTSGPGKAPYPKALGLLVWNVISRTLPGDSESRDTFPYLETLPKQIILYHNPQIPNL